MSIGYEKHAFVATVSQTAAARFGPKAYGSLIPADAFGAVPSARPEPAPEEKRMAEKSNNALQELIDGLQEDLSREYQAIIAYTVYSNVLKGAQWMNIAAELTKHATQELQHALVIADQIDYLGAMPNASPKAVKLSEKPEEMLQFDLDNETETIRAYRKRVRQAEAVGHYALAEQIRNIISQEQEHQHDLATALGIDVPHILEGGA
jgi:bacterioferritin